MRASRGRHHAAIRPRLACLAAHVALTASEARGTARSLTWSAELAAIAAAKLGRRQAEPLAKRPAEMRRARESPGERDLRDAEIGAAREITAATVEPGGPDV